MTTRTRSSRRSLDAAPDASPEARPGVPMETKPRPDAGAHWQAPAAQRSTVKVFTRAGGPGLTPVFGTAQPPARLSGALRALAYRIPETRASHWMTLLLSDRVDSWEHRVGGMAKGDPAEYRALVRNLAGHPVRTALLAAGATLLFRRLTR